MSESNKRAVRLIGGGEEGLPSIEFQQSIAVVIGVNDYSNGIPALRTPRADAERLTEILAEEHGYETELLVENVTAARLTTLLAELRDRIGEHDRLLFYFAGHGIALDGDDGPAGYLVPQDADIANPNTFLPMQAVHDALASLTCRHCLIILDCCFSGAFRWAATRSLIEAPDTLYRERYERFLRSPAWQVLTSAAYDQEALDALTGSGFGTREDEARSHSPFALALFDALTGAGDANNDGVVVATELYLYLRDHVEIRAEDEANHQQTPGIWPLLKHDKGEFVFLTGEPDLPPAPALTAENNPYRGLQSFDAEHAELFFGRQSLIEKLAAQVDAQPLTVVLGASGTGKSSLVKAGLAPRFEASGDYHVLPPMRPGEAPLTALAELLDTHFPKRSDPVSTIEATVSTWCEAHPNQRLLLIVDQCEELVTLCRDEKIRRTFLQTLADLLAAHPDKIRIIFTLRSDFEPQFHGLPLFIVDAEGAPLLLSLSASRFIVPPMNQAELRQVIEGPANVRVLFFDPSDLVDSLIDEVIQTPGALPLLSFTLEQLYLKYLSRQEEAKNTGEIIERSLTQEDYDKLGGVIGSLRTRADKEYAELPDKAHRETMRRVMLRMVAVEGGELARRRVPRQELDYPNEDENQRVGTVIARLTKARLLVSDSTTADGDSHPDAYIEPAHDALIRAWDQLLRWKQDFEEYLSLQRTLTADAVEWQATGGDPKSGLLWNNDPRLPQLQAILIPMSARRKNNFLETARQSLWPPTRMTDDPTWLNELDTTFVQASIVRGGNVLKRIAAITLIVMILLSGLTIFAFVQQQQAKSSANALAGEVVVRSTAEAVAVAQEAEAVDAQGTAVAEADARATEVVVRSTAEAKAVAAEATAVAERNEAQRQAAISRASELAASTQAELDEEDPDNSLSLLLGSAAIEATHTDYNGLVMPQAAEALDAALRAAPPWVRNFPDARHTGEVRSTRYSPDGSKIVTAGLDGTARIWNAADGRQLVALVGHDGGVNFAVFSPDGQSIATTGADGTVRIWNVETGAALKRLDTHDNIVNMVRFSPDGQHLVTASDDKTARVWELSTGDLLHTLADHTDVVLCASFGPDGTLIATCSWDRLVILWDADTGAHVRTIDGHDESVRTAEFDGSGARLVTAGWDRTARVWSVADGSQELVLDNHDDFVCSASFSPDDRTIVTTTYDGYALLWNARDGKELRRFGRHELAAWDADFHPDGHRLTTASADKFAKVWDIESGKLSLTITGQAGGMRGVGFGADDETIATASDDGTIVIWDVESAIPLASMAGHTSKIRTLAYDTPHARIVTVGETDAPAIIWDAETGDRLATLQGSRGARAAAFSPDGTRVVTVHTDRRTRVWDVTDITPGKPPRFISTVLRTFPEDSDDRHTARLRFVAVSPDNRFVATASADGTAKLWDLQTGELLRTYPQLDAGLRTVAFSPDGSALLAAAAENTARVWDVESGVELMKMDSHEGGVQNAVYDSTGRYILTVSSDETARVWDVESGTELMTLRGHNASVLSGAFSSDGVSLVTVGDDKFARLWRFDPMGQLVTVMAMDESVQSAEWDPTGRTFVTAAGDDTVRIFDAGSGEQLFRFGARTRSHVDTVFYATFSPNGAYVASGSMDTTLKIWDVASGLRLHELTDHAEYVKHVAFDPTSEYLVSASGDGRAKVWRVESGELVATLGGRQRKLQSATFSPDGNSIAMAATNGTIQIWGREAVTATLAIEAHNGWVNYAEYSPDGSQIVSAGQDQVAKLWDASTGELLRTFAGHQRDVLTARFNAEGTLIVTASLDGTAKVWNKTNGRLLITLTGHRKAVNDAVFSPDGSRILTASADSTVRTWYPDIESMMAASQALIQRNPPIMTASEQQDYGFLNDDVE